MPYYHVYVDYEDKRGERYYAFVFNLPEKLTREKYANPYMKCEAFMVGGRVIDHSKVERIDFYISKKKFQELVLPNGMSPADTINHTWVADCFDRKLVKGVTNVTWDFVTSPPQKPTELSIGLMNSASFLELDTNWFVATCALQLQEVAMTLVAKKKKIELDKANVERLLNKKIGDLSFNDKYKAFSKQVKSSFNIEMPILTTHLRKMRAKVLHEGYNPKPEETESIANFTTGLLRRLKDIR